MAHNTKTAHIEKRLGIEHKDSTIPDNVLRRYIPSYLYQVKLLGPFLELINLYVDRLIIQTRYVRDYWEINK